MLGAAVGHQPAVAAHAGGRAQAQEALRPGLLLVTRLLPHLILKTSILF